MSLRLLTAGESHGRGIIATLEGLPAGLKLDLNALNRQMARRQMGYGRGGRMKIEKDQVDVLAGMRNGETTGAPLCLAVWNKDWDNWTEVMDPWKGNAEKMAKKAVRVPRPGHADLAGMQAFGREDGRDILERSSARETAARVAAGSICRQMLEQLGVEIRSAVLAIGSLQVEGEPTFADMADLDDHPGRMPGVDPQALIDLVDETHKAKDTLGGIFLTSARGVPAGLGSNRQWDLRLDGRLAQAFLSVPAVKAVSIGEGVENATRLGSESHDPMLPPVDGKIQRPSNRAGGLEGGFTNGEDILVKGYLKPIATLMQPLPSVNLDTLEAHPAVVERSDTTAVAAASVIGEAVLALILAEAFTAAFGGMRMDALKDAVDAHRQRIRL